MCTANVVGLVFNIYCLKMVDASYFQVARGLTLPMTVVLQSMMTGEKPTRGTIASCGLVTWGFTYAFMPAPFLSTAAVAANTGTNLTVGREAPFLGMVLGVFSAAMVAIHAVLIKSALKSVEGKTLDLAYWQNALSAIALLPAILISGEVRGMVRLVAGAEGSLRGFVTGSALTVSRCLFTPLPRPMTHPQKLIPGCRWIPHLHRRPFIHQSHLARHAHVFCGRPFRPPNDAGRMDLLRRAQCEQDHVDPPHHDGFITIHLLQVPPDNPGGQSGRDERCQSRVTQWV